MWDVRSAGAGLKAGATNTGATPDVTPGWAGSGIDIAGVFGRGTGGNAGNDAGAGMIASFSGTGTGTGTGTGARGGTGGDDGGGGGVVGCIADDLAAEAAGAIGEPACAVAGPAAVGRTVWATVMSMTSNNARGASRRMRLIMAVGPGLTLH